MSDNTDVCDHGPVAVGVAPDHQAAVGVDVIVLSISAGGAEVGADRGSHFHVLENFFETMPGSCEGHQHNTDVVQGAVPGGARDVQLPHPVLLQALARACPPAPA